MAASELADIKSKLRGSKLGDFGTARRFLQLARENSLCESELVVSCGKTVLQRTGSLGDELWTIYEQTCIAALDTGDFDVADDCLKKLVQQFPKSKRVLKLKGLRLEAKGEYQTIEGIYNTVLAADPTDQTILKRKIAIEKAQGHIERVVKLLVEYLNVFMADTEAWLELADIYFHLQLYEKAAFCFEELIVAQPQNYHLYVKYADILRTIGGIENLEMARKYYSFALELSSENNARALYGLAQVTNALASTTKAKENKDPVLNSKLNALAINELKKAIKSDFKTALDNLDVTLESLEALSISEPSK